MILRLYYESFFLNRFLHCTMHVQWFIVHSNNQLRLKDLYIIDLLLMYDIRNIKNSRIF